MKNPEPAPLRILVAPLDWGLGHATRCIPLIRSLLECGCDVWIAADGRIRHLLEQEFPNQTFLDLKGYNIRYPQRGGSMVRTMLSQLPGILETIRYEHRWLQEVVSRFRISAVVSDNRFGLYHSRIPCVYITHQLLVKSPAGAWTEAMLQKLHYRYINRFSACWVPDFKESPNLSGLLAHPIRLPAVPLFYLGPLSRLEKKSHAQTNPLLIVLSGPEPQRTLFEDQILRQLEAANLRAVLVRGLPGGQKSGSSEAELLHQDAIREEMSSGSLAIMDRLKRLGRLVVYNHLPSAMLAELLASSAWVIGRTGYTTVMDLVLLNKKSILVPTPGQPEQEYLGPYLRSQGLSYTLSQHSFSLEKALQEAAGFDYRFPALSSPGNYKQIVADWVRSIRQP